MKYCPECGVNYGFVKREYGKEYCSNGKHHTRRIALREWEHERVELVSSSYEDGGHCSGDVGNVVDVKSCVKTGEIDLRIKWDNGAEECWLAAEDCLPY